jgi:hypothetical protein
VDENVRTTVIGSKEAPIKAQSGQSSPLRGGSPANPVVQRDDGLWSIGWHDGAAGPFASRRHPGAAAAARQMGAA